MMLRRAGSASEGVQGASGEVDMLVIWLLGSEAGVAKAGAASGGELTCDGFALQLCHLQAVLVAAPQPGCLLCSRSLTDGGCLLLTDLILLVAGLGQLLQQPACQAG